MGGGPLDIDVDGLRIAYDRAGEGEPLLLVHGAMGDSRFWRPQLGTLSREFDVVAWDAPGCGRSGDPPDGFPLAAYADCLAAFVRALGLDRPHVLGHSFGGGLAIELCRRHPELPRTLVLAGAYAGWAGSLTPDEVDARLAGVLGDLERAPEEVVARALPSLLGEDAAPEAAAEVAAMVSEFRPGGTRTMAFAFAEADLRDALPGIGVPTLVLHAECDARSRLAVARALHTAIPGAEIVVLEGVGHDSSLEAPDRFDAAVLRFLRAVG